MAALLLLMLTGSGCQSQITGDSVGMGPAGTSASAGYAADPSNPATNPAGGGAAPMQESGGSMITNDRAFSCNPATDDGVSPQRLWRLTGEQYLKTVGVAMGDRQDDANAEAALFISPAVPFDYVAPDRFSTYSFSYSMSDTEFRRVIDAADYIADQLMQDNHCCLPKDGSIPGDDCIQHLGSLLFSRPLSADEISEYRGAAEQAKQSGAGNPSTAPLEAMLMAPQFLFRTEIGTPDGTGKNKLDPFEVARALSYSISNSPPDKPLWQAAVDGKLATVDDIQSQISRLLPADKLSSLPKVKQFFSEFLEYPKVASVFKDAKDIEGWSPVDLIADTEALIIDVLDQHTSKDFLKTLLTTNEGYYGSYTQFVYGDYKDATDRGPQRHLLPADQRAGILTQPSWLAGFSSANENKPVQRGRFISESLLCRPTRSLPIGMIPKLPDDPNQSLRDRLKLHAAGACQACHQDMDPIGLAFETYDHYGRYRTMDAGRPADGSGELTGSGNQDGPFKTPLELVNKLASSSAVEQCFVRQSFRYWLGRNEQEFDACSLANAKTEYDAKGGDYQAMVGKIFTSPSFLYRRSN